MNELDFAVFGAGVLLTALAVLGFALRDKAATSLITGINDSLMTNLGWAYLLIMFVLVVFVGFLIFSPWGNITLGTDEKEPAFSFSAYFAMLYSAGIAAGIVFWGPAEAIFHYDTVSPFIGADPRTSEAAVGAIQYTFFHWGISAWTAYVTLGIPIAYYGYVYDAPLRVSTILTPWVGLEGLDGIPAKVVDILAVFATIGGVAATLGFVGNQFLVGIEWTTGAKVGDLMTVLVITTLTVAFTASVTFGVNRGIRRISNFNLALFLLLMGATFLLGPTRYIAAIGTEALGGYLSQFVTMSFYTGVSAGDSATVANWVGNWTVFYWAWWFSWAPFVGLFIARISRGRTVRQVAVTGVLASTGITIPWFATMGGSAIYLQQTGQANILSVVSNLGAAASGYPLFEALPLGNVLTVLFLVLVTTFFITSADSSTLALGMLTTGGSTEPSAINRIVWGTLIGALASLLMVSGGVKALQSTAIITGGPFALITLIAVASMIRTFGNQESIFLRDTDDTVVPGSETVIERDPADD